MEGKKDENINKDNNDNIINDYDNNNSSSSIYKSWWI